MGSIGAIVARHMHAFGAKVIYHNRNKLPDECEFIESVANTILTKLFSPTLAEHGAEYVADLSDFLGRCDVVSIHIPLSDATRHFISTKEFAMFKQGARLVNTARGPVVDEEALVEALKSGQLSGAALDVFEKEPEIHPWLLQADNVLLQPHTGVSKPSIWILVSEADHACM